MHKLIGSLAVCLDWRKYTFNGDFRVLWWWLQNTVYWDV